MAPGPVTLGGGILNTGADLTLSSVVLVDNQAGASDGANAAGGGVANVFNATLTVKDSRFEGNKALAGTGQSYGGAIFNDAGSTLTVQDCTFTGNQATGGLTHVGSRGGAIANAGHSQASVMDSVFRNNLAQGGNGAAEVRAGNGGGGAILNLTYGVLDASSVGATLTVRDSIFTGQSGHRRHGGRRRYGGQGQGGAINTIGEGALTFVTSSEFSRQCKPKVAWRCVLRRRRRRDECPQCGHDHLRQFVHRQPGYRRRRSLGRGSAAQRLWRSPFDRRPVLKPQCPMRP